MQSTGSPFQVWPSLRLRTKGLVVVALPLLALFLTTALFLYSQLEHLRLDREIREDSPIRTSAERLLTLLLQAEAGIRNFLLMPTGHSQDVMHESFIELEKEINGLRNFRTRFGNEFRVLENLAQDVISIHQRIHPPHVSDAHGQEELKQWLLENQGRMEEIQRLVAEVQRESRALASERQARSERIGGLTRLTVLLGLLLGVAGGLLSISLFTSGVARRVQLVADASRLIAQGRQTNLDVAGEDEIGDLARATQRTGELLRDQHLQLTERTAALEAKSVQLLTEAEERARVASALQSSEMRFRLFMENISAAAFLKTADGVYIYGNAAWRSQFSEVSEPVGLTDAELWPAHIARIFETSDRRMLVERRPVQTMERVQLEQEEIVWLVTKFPIEQADAQPMIGGLAMDVTASTRLEDQLHQVQKMEAIGVLAGGIAHDFNNLLTVILGYCQLMIPRLADFEEVRQDVLEIQSAAEQAAVLTSQLLAFSRKQQLEPKVVNLNELLRASQGLVTRLLRADVELKLVLAADLATVEIDPIQFQQVFFNLASNARDAMNGHGSLIIETSNCVLEEEIAARQTVRPGPYVRLSFTDTGAGIDAETQSRMFEPFFTTKEMGRGTGLGLSTVYGIVRQSGGYISVRSAQGKGTTFQVFLPVSGEPLRSELAAEPDGSPARTGEGEMILLAEDDAAVGSMMATVCTQAGYQVIRASNGQEALEQFQNRANFIDLLITDVVMPGMSGEELAAAVRKQRPTLPILYCSGYSDHAIVDHGSPGFDLMFLAKPFTPRILLERIRVLLSTV